jgi:multimeric flavodoxin WrbA
MTKILVLYHSQQYGNTAAMARAVAEGARAAGAEVTLYNTNEGRYDIEQYRSFDAVAVGTPDYYSYFAGTLKVFLDDWYLAKQVNPAGITDKPIALFFTHGGGGAALTPFERLFSRLGNKIGSTVESMGKPTAGVLERCKALGKQLAENA